MATWSVGRSPRLFFVLALVAASAAARAQHEGPAARYQVASSHRLPIGGAVLQVDFAVGPLDLPIDTVLAHIRAAASAVAGYYGKFPVPSARILIVPTAGRSGILQGTTWGNMGGNPAFTRIRLGQHTTAADLADDWMTTHEMVHMGFPSMPDDQHWMEEGQATYIEPIARAATGELDARKVWGDMVRDMSKGEPQPGDLGLDHTHTWGRTYWGGALFCLVADVSIRRETNNRKSLQDALRAVVAHDGTIDYDWPLDKALAVGDRATGTHVLTRMYAEWKDKAVPVDLPRLWDQLGIRSSAEGIEFVPTAPFAAIRAAITAHRAANPVAHARGSHTVSTQKAANPV
ncbi:MAG TPA: hypothetical protein VGG85_00090 [Terracidiphilus sp.]|jgi:hypothetical protein